MRRNFPRTYLLPSSSLSQEAVGLHRHSPDLLDASYPRAPVPLLCNVSLSPSQFCLVRRSISGSRRAWWCGPGGADLGSLREQRPRDSFSHIGYHCMEYAVGARRRVLCLCTLLLPHPASHHPPWVRLERRSLRHTVNPAAPTATAAVLT